MVIDNAPPSPPFYVLRSYEPKLARFSSWFCSRTESLGTSNADFYGEIPVEIL